MELVNHVTLGAMQEVRVIQVGYFALMLDTRSKTPYANVSYRFVITSNCKMSTDLLQFARFWLCNNMIVFFVK